VADRRKDRADCIVQYAKVKHASSAPVPQSIGARFSSSGDGPTPAAAATPSPTVVAPAPEAPLAASSDQSQAPEDPKVKEAVGLF